MKPWKTLSRKTVLRQPPWLVVEQHEVELPDGRIIPDWSWVITPDYVNVIALTGEGRIPCFRQSKYGLSGPALGMVGGFVEPGEEPLQAARRELLEETGFEAVDWHSLGSYRVDPNRGVAMAHFFAATGAHRVAAPTGGDLEEQELLMLTPGELEKALDDGRVPVLAWAAALSFALRRLKQWNGAR